MFQVMVLGLLFPFEALWMAENGLRETTIGFLGGTVTMVIFLSGLGWGIVADKTQKPHRLAMIGFLGASGSLFYFATCSELWQFWIYAPLMGFFLGSIFTMMPMLAVSAFAGRTAGRDYALYRVFGSMGWIIGTLVLARIAGDLRMIILLGATLALLGPLPLAGFKHRISEHRHYVSVWKVLHNRRLSAFYISIALYALAMPATFRFTSLYAVEEMGADKNFVGLLMSINGFVALIGLPMTGLMTDRFGCRLLILLALIAQPLRTVCYSLAPTYHWLIAPQAFHFFTWAGLEVAGMIYVSRTALPGNRATALAMFIGAQTIGRLVGAPLAGYLAEHVGYIAMYWTSAGIAALGLLTFVTHLIADRRLVRSEETAALPEAA
jgi:MFS family permease